MSAVMNWRPEKVTCPVDALAALISALSTFCVSM
jgi:hypothetical protein